jgi:hypothetical protein
MRSLKRDQNACRSLGSGSYSDAVIVDNRTGEVVNTIDFDD